MKVTGITINEMVSTTSAYKYEMNVKYEVFILPISLYLILSHFSLSFFLFFVTVSFFLSFCFLLLFSFLFFSYILIPIPCKIFLFFFSQISSFLFVATLTYYASGLGQFVSGSTGITYSGSWKDGLKEGQGSLLFPSKDIMTGRWKEVNYSSYK